jgi:hypothetical protein
MQMIGLFRRVGFDGFVVQSFGKRLADRLDVPPVCSEA